MAEFTKIQWADRTFNPWRGCSKYSKGCKFCYAERDSNRNPAVLGVWGPDGTREVAAEAQWNGVRRWQEVAEHDGVTFRVFCASIADVFEGPDTLPRGYVLAVANARAKLFELIATTPNLTWMLLTKRSDGIKSRIREVAMEHGYRRGAEMARRWIEDKDPPRNVWLGVSVEDQETSGRMLDLVNVPAAVRFLSIEPLLGPIHLGLDGTLPAAVTGTACVRIHERIHWVIVGGESGAQRKARPFDLAWAESIVAECQDMRVPVFVKQFGRNPEAEGMRLRLIDDKGGDMQEWPENLRVRQLPDYYDWGGLR